MGLTPLMLVAFTGQTEAMKYLIQKGANVKYKADDGGTALHGACFLGQFEAVRLLVENGADVNALNEDGEIPLKLAAAPWDEEMKIVFQIVTGVLQIKVDPEHTKVGRPKVVAYLRKHLEGFNW